MAELLVISGLGLVGSILVQSGTSIAAFGIIYKSRAFISRYTTMKVRSRKAKKMVKKGIENLDYELFKKGFERCQYLDEKYDTSLFIKYLKKYKLTNEIIDSKILFSMKFDGEYLVKKYNISSTMSPRDVAYEDMLEDRLEDIENKKNKLRDLIDIYESKSDLDISDITLSEKKEEMMKKEDYVNQCIKKLYSF